MLGCDKCDRAITPVFCHDLPLIFMFSGLLQEDLFKDLFEDWRKVFSNKIIIATLVIQGFPSSFLSRPIA